MLAEHRADSTRSQGDPWTPVTFSARPRHLVEKEPGQDSARAAGARDTYHHARPSATMDTGADTQIPSLKL